MGELKGLFAKEKEAERVADVQLVGAILRAVIANLNFNQKKILHLQTSDFLAHDAFRLSDDLSNYHNSKIHERSRSKHLTRTEFIDCFNNFFTKINSPKKTYDLIFTDLPPLGFTLPPELYFSTLDQLNINGIGAYLIPGFQGNFKERSGRQYLDLIHEKGFKVLGVLGIPNGSSSTFRNIKSSILFVTNSTKTGDAYFSKFTDTKFPELQAQLTSIGLLELYDLELKEEITKTMADPTLRELGILDQIERDANLFDGIVEKAENFYGFDHWEQSRQINRLDSEYGGYALLGLSEISEISEIKSGHPMSVRISPKENPEHNENAIYISSKKVIEVSDEFPIGELNELGHNFFQVTLTDQRLKKEYLIIYFNSLLGQECLQLEFLKRSDLRFSSRLRLQDIENLQIPAPNLYLQYEIISNVGKLQKVKELLDEIEKNISIKPISSSEQLDKLNQIYESSIELSDSEITFNDIQKGETLAREFKQTFALDIKTKQKESYIVEACVKAVAGFLNGTGGSLYIGVHDNTEITGLEVEVGRAKLYKNMDKYQLAIIETLKSRLGATSLQNVIFVASKIKGRMILKLECKKSEQQIFLDKTLTYIRRGPSTVLLEGEALMDYSKRRFPRV